MNGDADIRLGDFKIQGGIRIPVVSVQADRTGNFRGVAARIDEFRTAGESVVDVDPFAVDIGVIRLDRVALILPVIGVGGCLFPGDRHTLRRDLSCVGIGDVVVGSQEARGKRRVACHAVRLGVIPRIAAAVEERIHPEAVIRQRAGFIRADCNGELAGCLSGTAVILLLRVDCNGDIRLFD